MADDAGPKRVLLTGATGFVGGDVLKRLVSSGFVPVCVVRDPDKFAPRAGSFAGAEIAVVQGDVTSAAAIQRAADQSDLAIHMVGIIMERRHNTFSRVHYEGTRNVVSACQAAGIKRFIHMSALGTRPDAVSKYHQSKYMAEQLVKQSGLDWTIFRPSVIHGPEGEFMELMKTFACSMLLPPFMPYFGKGQARVQPVDVRDVAACFVKALAQRSTIHQTYELGGPATYSFRQIMQMILRETGRKRLLLPVPYWLASLDAAFLELMPNPPLTRDQVKLLKRDNVVSGELPGLADLDIQPTGAEAILPTYLDRYRAAGRKTAA